MEQSIAWTARKLSDVLFRLRFHSEEAWSAPAVSCKDVNPLESEKIVRGF